MMQLPEIKQLDIATPIATYYATKRQNELDSLSKENIRADNEVNRMKLDEYKAGAAQRAKDAEMDRVIKAVSMDKEFMAMGEKMLLNLNPDDPDFQQKGIAAAVDMAKYAHSRGMPAEYAAGLAERMVKMYSPEATKQARIKAGYEKAPEKPPREFRDGQMYTVDKDGNPIAIDVAGAKPKEAKEKELSPMGKMLAERNATQPGSEERKIYDNALASKFGQSAEGYESFTPEQKTFFLDQALTTGERPFFGSGFKAANDYKAFSKDLADYANNKGITGRDVMANKETFKADASSQKSQTKNLDYMTAFASNIDMQIDRVNELYKDVSRFDTRILNVPLIEAKKMLAGSPEESKLAVYIKEIQNESARLSSANAQSIAALPVGAQEDWAKLIDGNLSIADAVSLLDEIKKTAAIRVGSASQQLDATKARVRGSAEQPSAPIEPKQNVSTSQTKQLDATVAKQYLQKAGGDKTKARELAKRDGYSF